MKRLLSPLVVLLSLSLGTGIAAAAIRATTPSTIVLDTGGDPLLLTSLAGVGFAGKGAMPTPVDVKFSADPQGEGFGRVRDYLNGRISSLDATVKLLDFNSAAKQQFGLGSAQIVEVEIPGVDARDGKGSFEFRMRLQPKALHIQTGSGSVALKARSKNAIQRGNFRVSIDGVAEPYITAVAPVVVRRSGRQVQISGLEVTLDQAHGLTGDWQKWIEAAQAAGGGEKGGEKTLKIELLDNTLAKALFAVEFKGVNLEALDVQSMAANVDQTPLVKISLSAASVALLN